MQICRVFFPRNLAYISNECISRIHATYTVIFLTAMSAGPNVAATLPSFGRMTFVVVSCGAHWYSLPGYLSRVLQVCPFCGLCVPSYYS